MLPEEQEINPNDPRKLLQEQVTLMREIKTTLASIQESQIHLQQSITNLVKLNAGMANDGLDVFVENFNMPFFAMVGFMIKWIIASIPAGIIVFVLILLAFAAVSLLCGGLAGIITALSHLSR